MFAIAFDLKIEVVQKFHPQGLEGVSAANREIALTLRSRGFERVQGSVYTTDSDSMANLFAAIQDLKTIPWFPKSVRDLRAFRIENWSDFTEVVKT